MRFTHLLAVLSGAQGLLALVLLAVVLHKGNFGGGLASAWTVVAAFSFVTLASLGVSLGVGTVYAARVLRRSTAVNWRTVPLFACSAVSNALLFYASHWVLCYVH